MGAETHIRRGAPGAYGARLIVLAALMVAGLASLAALGLSPAGLSPGQGGLRVAGDFLGRALSPALDYQGDVPAGTPPILLKALAAARTTVVFAAAAIGLSVLAGLLLGFLASNAWWDALRGGEASRAGRLLRPLIPVLYGGVRVLIALMRSVHELLWAVLFLAAFGISNLAAVIAIAIPYAGTLAKVFGEMIDEADTTAAVALRQAGASAPQVFVFGLLPRALPDIGAYAFYRFECALRSSAVLGFFGFPTLGYYLSASFENLYYGEVWTYLYTLVVLVALADLWSGALRRRLLT